MISIHKKKIAATRKNLAGMIRENLLMRRSLLEAAIRECEKQGVEWRETPSNDDEKLSISEQYDLISEALLNLDPTSTVVGLKQGEVKVKTFNVQ